MAACASTAPDIRCGPLQLYREAILMELMQVNLPKIIKLDQGKFVASAGAFSTATP